MKSPSISRFVAPLHSHWAQRRSLILGSSLLLLAAVLSWQVSARLTASAKSNSLTTTTIEATTIEPAAVVQGGGCNNCCGSWSQKSNIGPAPRDVHAMAYAQQCNRVVMFGGQLATGGVAPANVTDETWEWNGTTMTWAQFTPATRPAARGQHAMAYDAARKQVVLFGGYNANFGGLNDTWVYDCVTHTWTQKFPANSPSARHRHAMAYDPNKQLVVLYGGGSSFQDTWTWDGTNWVEIVGANQPGIRNEHAMAFDGTRVILFGGSKNAGLADNDTWDLTLTSPSAGTWTMIAANGSGPNKRQRHAMAYAPNCQKVVLFGGNSDIDSYANDTWEWSRASLSWCQTSVASPPSPGRQYHAMAYDGRGALMYGGINSSLAQLGDTWRFACSIAYTKRAGKMDNFNLPTDPTSATTAFKANVDGVYSTPPKMDFDEPTTNKFLLQSFTGLPSNIVRAELEVRAQPNGGASNDSIHLDFPPFNAPSFTWGKNFFALHPGGTWDPGQGAYTFILDLCNLPAGGAGQPTNLLGLLNANHSLHIMIQDDTSVDYIKLRVWSCPPRVQFAGLPHEPFNNTTLELLTSPTGVEQLQINPSPAARTDVKVDLGQASGWQANLLPVGDLRQTGKVLESWIKGRVGGVDDQFIGRSVITGNGNSATLAVDFSNIGSPMSLVELFDPNGQLVGSFTSPNNAAIQTVECPAGAQPLRVCRTQWRCEPNKDVAVATFCEVICVSHGGLFYSDVSMMRVSALGITQPREFVSEGVIGGVNLGPLTITDESVQVSNRFVQALGTASFEPFAGNLAVAGIGSSGQDGVSINLGKALSAALSFDTLDPMGTLPDGAYVQVAATGVVNNQSAPVGSLMVVRKRVPWDKVRADFSALGSTLQRVQVFNGNTQVADVSDFSGDIGVSVSPNRYFGTLPKDFHPKFTAVFPPSTAFMIGNLTVQGDSIRITPLTPSVTPTYLTDLAVTAADMVEFTLTGVEVTPFCNSTISLSPTSLPNAATNSAYDQQLTASGGVAPYTFAVTAGTLNAGLSLDQLTGRITGMPTSAGQATFTVTATDDNGCTGSQQYTLTALNCPTVITVNPATAPNGTVGTSYNLTFTASGGNGPYTFARTTGTLPPGLILAGSGALTGTPTTPGTFNFTVEATAANGCPGTKAYSLTINPLCGTIVVNPATVANGFVGTAYSQTFTASGGNGPYTFARVTGTLPPGLTLNAATGLLSGTPTTAGTYTFTVEATASNGCTGTRDYTVTISGSGLQFFTLPAPVRIVDTRPGQTACSTPGNPIAGGTSLTQAAAGFCGIPSIARAIIGNVTVVTPAANGFLTIFPSSAGQPTAANTNFIAGDVLNNVFTVGLGAADGAFKIFASTTTHIVVDVTGYFAPPQPAPATGLFLHMLPSPIRLEDTRPGQTACVTPGTPLPGGVDTTHQGTTTCSGVTIPSTARAIIGNVTVVGPAANGFLTLFPADTIRPLASSGNYRADTVLNSPFTVGLSPSGQFKIFASATTHVVIDVTGYYSPDVVDINGTGLLLTPITPARLVDSRPGLPACFNLGAPLPSSTDVLQGAANSCTIASTARAILGNVTVVTPAANGFLTFWPSDTPRPLISTSNYQAGRNFNRFFTTGLGAANGGFKMFSSQSINLVVDVSGYFAP